ncbi:hypothetical protein AG1IA_01335 [Rhizoctonia solani AG-1 IA]|uniref:Uncharacterized protein n=1 Tax=Thanatephorus cucumeris (strain AG1-IA) TaxID=983506 RepID=L8X6H2_THACA|nr:hypothetical protein AG1IA_01335 [Rhizoctonia solani AG-1 IA]
MKCGAADPHPDGQPLSATFSISLDQRNDPSANFRSARPCLVGPGSARSCFPSLTWSLIIVRFAPAHDLFGLSSRLWTYSICKRPVPATLRTRLTISRFQLDFPHDVDGISIDTDSACAPLLSSAPHFAHLISPETLGTNSPGTRLTRKLSHST